MENDTSYDAVCDYDALDAYADKLMNLTGESFVGGARIVSAANAVKMVGEWDGRDTIVSALRGVGNEAAEHVRQLHDLGSKMKRIAQSMREADTAAQTALDQS